MLNQNAFFNEIFAPNLKNLAHWNYFFNDHKTVTNHNFQNLIRRKLSNDEFLNTVVIVANAPVEEKQNKFLPTDASFRILERYKEVVSINDNAVGSCKPTEKKTKNLGNIGLDIETDLRDFEEKIHIEELARVQE
jgi:disulfide oxidoreductase YuzD